MPAVVLLATSDFRLNRQVHAVFAADTTQRSEEERAAARARAAEKGVNIDGDERSRRLKAGVTLVVSWWLMLNVVLFWCDKRLASFGCMCFVTAWGDTSEWYVHRCQQALFDTCRLAGCCRPVVLFGAHIVQHQHLGLHCCSHCSIVAPA